MMSKMKFAVVLGLTVIIVAFLAFVGNRQFPKLLEEKEENSVAELPTQAIPPGLLEQSFAIQVGQNSYRAVVTKVANKQNLALIPNFTDRMEGEELAEKNNCIRAINGGFYTNAYSPLGLFVVKNDVIGAVHKNDTIDGFLWVNSNGDSYIAKALPDDWSGMLFVLQAGPVVKIDNREFTKLSIVNDESARRSMIGIDGINNVFFMSVFDEKHLLGGPYLSDLPEVLRSIERSTKTSFTDVLNLDGGTASFLQSEDLTIPELVLVGSLICEKK